MDSRFLTNRQLPICSSYRGTGVDPVSRLYTFYVRARGFHYPSCVRSRRVGQLRLSSVCTGTNIGLDGIHPNGLDAHQHLSRTWSGIRYFLEPENFRSAKLDHANRFHVLSPPV